MSDAAELAQAHWNETPLFLTEEERYSTYPWLYEAAEVFANVGVSPRSPMPTPKSTSPGGAIFWRGVWLIPGDQRPKNLVHGH